MIAKEGQDLDIRGAWKAIAATKQAERLSKIPEEWRVPKALFEGQQNVTMIPLSCGILSEKEVKITSDFDATDLLEKLRLGEFTSEEVVTAFCKRAAIAQQLTNCLTEIFFEDAISRARKLDAERKTEPTKSFPPLWGLPISLKDSFQVPGIDASCGIASLVNDPSSEYSVLPMMLLDLGAVLYVKTNVPQTLMTADSDNNVFGRTLNPNNINLTAGGSTGGEGALVALRGSILGIGTDIAGSIRIPSIANGIYGFKPSIGVIPYSRQRRLSVPGVEGVKAVAGPMVTSIRDAQMFMKIIIQAQPWKYDSAVNRMVFQGLPTPEKENIVIGLLENDGAFTPHPPVRRAMREAAAKLEKAGVKVVPIQMPDISSMYAGLFKFFRAAGAGPLRKMLDATEEPDVVSVQKLRICTEDVQPATLEEYLQLFVDRENAQTYIRGVFLENNLSALLAPGAPHVALPHDLYKDVTYTGLWNYLDHPATIIPTGHVLPTDSADDIEHAKFGEEDRKVYAYYDGPKTFQDAPTVVQLVGYRQQDEELAAIAVLVDSLLKS